MVRSLSGGQVCLLQKIIAISLCLSIISLDILYAIPSETTVVEAVTSSGTVHELSIPSKIGTVDEFHQGTNGKTIIYIQDAHDSLEAQENISKIIHYLVKNYGVKTVFEEGYEGPVPTDAFFSIFKDPRAKKKVSYFLMDKLRLGGAEYAHVNRTEEFNLIGVDSIELHKENIEWYKKSSEVRDSVGKDLEAIRNEVEVLANARFPKELKTWMKLKDRLDKNQMNLSDYLKRIAKRDLRAYPGIKVLLRAESAHDKKVIEEAKNIDAKKLLAEIDRFENDYASSYLTNQRDREIHHIYKAFNLLKRLNRIEVTPEEFDLVRGALRVLGTKKIAEFLFEVTGKPLILSNLWEPQIQNAVHFYETAEARDGLLEKALSGRKIKADNAPAVLVFGGFHKNRIKSILNKRNYSYVIITPRITQMSDVHRSYYKHLMGGGYHSFEVPFFVGKAAPPERVLEMFDLPISGFLNYIAGSEVGSDELVKDALEAARSEVRSTGGQRPDGLPESEDPSREAVVARIKTMSRSGIEDWGELLTLMESYPQYFDRIYLDLDETLFTSKVYLGSHQWHVDEAKYFESGRWRLSAKKSLIEKELVERGLLRLVEPRLVEVLREMKRRNPNLIVQGLTSRREFMKETTEQILKFFGLSDLEVKYDAYKGRKVEAIHRDLAADERPERGITLFVDDEADDFAKHKLMKTIEQMGTVVIPNRKVSSFNMETSLSRFREGLAEGAAGEGAAQPGDHLIAGLLLSRFSEDAAGRAAVYLDPDIRRFVEAGSDQVKMAYIEASADFFSRSFDKRLTNAERDMLLDFYYGLASFDKDLWKQAHLEGKLTYQMIDRSLPFLHGRGNYELLLTPENAYFFMEPLLDYLVTEKPNVVLLPDTAARPFTESLRYFIEQEGLPTRVINFPISTGDARDTRYELTRWMRLLRGEIPAADEADRKLLAFLQQSEIDGVHSGDNVVIFDDGITRGHAVSMITDVIEDTFKAIVRGAFVAFDYRKNIDRRLFAAFSSFRVYGEFGARDTSYSKAPGVIVRLNWEFKPEFKGVASRRPYNPPPPKLMGEGGGGQVLEFFKDDYQRFFRRSQRTHRLPERLGDRHLTTRQYQLVNAADTVHLPDEIRGYAADVLVSGGLTREGLITELKKLAEAKQGGKLVKLLRKQAGLTLEELKSLTGVGRERVSISWISTLEGGKNALTNEEHFESILRGLKDAYEKDGRLNAEEVDYYVRKGFDRLKPEQVALPEESAAPAAKRPGGKDDGLSLIRVRDEVPAWVFEDKTMRPRDRRLLRTKNVFFYRIVRDGVDLGFVILAVLKNRAGEDSLVIEKIQPRIIHDQKVQAEKVRDLIVRYLSEDNKTIQALYTGTKTAYMAGVSESHRIRRDLSGGYFKLIPQTMDLWHEGTKEYYKDHLAGEIGMIWRRFDPDQQKRFESASKHLEAILTERPWGAALIKDAFEADISRYTTYRRMHLPFDQADLLVLEEIVRLLGEQQGAHTFADKEAEEETKFNVRANVELLKHQKLGIKPDFKKLYTRAGVNKQGKEMRQNRALRFFLGNFWEGGYDMAGMNWSGIQKRFAEWGAEDLLDKISGGKKERFLEYLMPGAYHRSGRFFRLRTEYRPSPENFQRYLNGEWYAVPIGAEYVIRGDEKIPPHWKDVPSDFFRSRRGHTVRFEIMDAGVVGHEISTSHMVKGVFFFREGKIHYEASRPGVIQRGEPRIPPGGINPKKMPTLDLKMRILQHAEDLMGQRVVAEIVQNVNNAIDRHPLLSSDPQKVLSDFMAFVEEASNLSKIYEIKRFFDSLIPRDDGSLRRSEVRAPGFDDVKLLVINRERVQNLRKKYVVPVDMDIFEALEPAQQEEFYKSIKMYSENGKVSFLFVVDIRGDRRISPAWSTVSELTKKHRNVKVKTLTSANIGQPLLSMSEIRGRKILGILKEGAQAIQAERLKEEIGEDDQLFWLKYILDSKEPGLLMSAIKLLDSGRDDLLRLKGFFTARDIPFSLLSEIRNILLTYEYVGQSA